MKICVLCILPETFPGIRFNEEGLCQYCLNYKGKAKLAEQRKKLKEEFEGLLLSTGHGTYDGLMSWSGGKDSTYTLTILKERYGLNILAFSFDHGFVSERARQNMWRVADKLGVDLLIFKPRFDLIRRVFVGSMNGNLYPKKALERASTICNSCMGLVKFIALKLAIEKNISFIFFGWSPGQLPLSSAIFKTNPPMIKAMMEATASPLQKIVGDELQPYFLTEKDFADASRFPYYISPLAFLEYDEEEIFARVKKLGWEKPDDTDPNSTNCLMNAFANTVHQEQMGYHPYVLELANLVREGLLSREEALARINTPPNTEIIQMVKERLGLSSSDSPEQR